MDSWDSWFSAWHTKHGSINLQETDCWRFLNYKNWIGSTASHSESRLRCGVECISLNLFTFSFKRVFIKAWWWPSFVSQFSARSVCSCCQPEKKQQHEFSSTYVQNPIMEAEIQNSSSVMIISKKHTIASYCIYCIADAKELYKTANPFDVHNLCSVFQTWQSLEGYAVKVSLLFSINWWDLANSRKYCVYS